MNERIKGCQLFPRVNSLLPPSATVFGSSQRTLLTRRTRFCLPATAAGVPARAFPLERSRSTKVWRIGRIGRTNRTSRGFYARTERVELWSLTLTRFLMEARTWEQEHGSANHGSANTPETSKLAREHARTRPPKTAVGKGPLQKGALCRKGCRWAAVVAPRRRRPLGDGRSETAARRRPSLYCLNYT